MATTGATAADKRKPDLKVVILGSASIGKTTLVHRYIEKHFQESIATIGASFSLKNWKGYNIALWDTAGEEKFRGLSNFYCRGAGAAILAFDMTDEDSFHALRAVFIPLLSAANEDCCNVVVGTKKDLVASQGRSAITIEDGFTLAQEVNKTHPDRPPYFETSSLTGDNVEEMFEYLFKWCEPKMAAGRPNAGISVAKDTPASGSSCSC